jgi:O-antigen/teichoic acid export membrane protein
MVIINNIGGKYAAYYYIDMMIINLLYIIPSAITNSLFAEGSYDNSKLRNIFTKSLKLNFLILLPGVVTVILVGKVALLTFGVSYSNAGYNLLVILAFSGIFYSLNNLLLSIFRIKHEIIFLIFINLLVSIGVICFSIILIPYRLTGIGYSLLIGQVMLSIIYSITAWKKYKL